MSWRERHADKLGTAGSIVAALCCLGTPALVAFLAAIGAGFLVNDLILLPLLAFSLGLALWGLGKGRRVHGRSGPEGLGWVGALAITGGIFVGGWLVAIGSTLLVGATIWNVLARRSCETSRILAR